MEIDELLDALRQEGERMAVAIERAGPDVAVRTCPDWTVRDLVHHTGEVHRWAATIVREGDDGSVDSEAARGPLPDDGALVDWFRDGHRSLVDALVAAPDDLECFAFLPAPSPRAFWARRQAHETGIHRADAESATGPMTPFPANVAIDGIEELLHGFGARRRSKLRSDPPVTLGLRAADGRATWRLSIEPEQLVIDRDVALDGLDAVVEADASTLLLFLWNRLPRTEVAVQGDARVLDLWAQNLQIRWS